jgi:hypothetical protein
MIVEKVLARCFVEAATSPISGKIPTVSKEKK